MSELILVTATPTALEIDPGESTLIAVTIQNASHVVDVFSLEVQGIDESWYQFSTNNVSLFPGDSASLSLTIQPPRESEALAGTHELTLRVVSQKDPAQQTTVPVTLVITPFHPILIHLASSSARGKRARFQVRIENRGNADITFDLRGRDPGGTMMFRFDNDEVRLLPGGSQTTEVTVEAGRRPLTGAPRRYAFEIVVTARDPSVEPQTLNALLECPPLVPRWAYFVAAAAAVGLGVGIWALFIRGGIADPVPGAPVVAIAAPVASPIVASVAISESAFTLAQDEEVQLTTTATDADGRSIEDASIEWSSSDSGVASVSSSGLVIGVGPGVATVFATAQGKSTQATITVTPVKVDTVTLSPLAIVAIVGGAIQVKAVVKDALGNELPSRQVTWSSTNPAVATVASIGASTGSVSGVAEGVATISASAEGKNGTATVTVSPVPPAAIKLEAAEIIVGRTTQLNPTIEDAAGNALTGRPVTWESDNADVATVSSTGEVVGVGPGVANITVTSGDVSQTVAVAIVLEPVASVEVSPAAESTTVGGTVQLAAKVKDGAGLVLTDREVVWVVDNPAVASVSSDGEVAGLSPGIVTVTATSEAKSDSATIAVTPIVVAVVKINPQTASLIVREALQLKATLEDAEENVLTGRTVVWTSDNPAVASVSNTGNVSAVAFGTATITAASEGKSAAVTVTVIRTPIARLDILPAFVTALVGESVQLIATLRDLAGNELTGRNVTWEADDPAVAAVSSTGLVSTLAEGSALVTAASENASSTATIRVRPQPVVRVALSPQTATLSVGETQSLSVTLEDADGNPLSGRDVAWTSSDPTKAGVSANGVVTAIQSGGATITAISEGIAGTASITIVFVFASVDAGVEHTCALTPLGAAHCWGHGGNGELGYGSAASQLVPTPVVGGLAFTSLSAGGSHTCGVTAQGQAYCWGGGWDGQLGVGSATSASQPVLVVGGLTMRSISAGVDHTCGITTQGEAYCWGYSGQGKLGDGSTFQSVLSPVAVSGGHTFTSISAGDSHSCGVTTQGAAYCWGSNSNGQLGIGSTADQTAPTPVSGALTFASVSASDFHTCGFTVQGEGHCWGSGFGGTLGNGATTSSTTPVPVSGGLAFTTLSTGSSHSCGLTAQGSAHCWGRGFNGQLGTGSSGNSATPVPVAGNHDFTSISAGSSYTCGVTASGAAFCWGLGSEGGLGNGLLGDQLAPIAVSDPL